jgi:hypothetical protein
MALSMNAIKRSFELLLMNDHMPSPTWAMPIVIRPLTLIVFKSSIEFLIKLFMVRGCTELNYFL